MKIQRKAALRAEEVVRDGMGGEVETEKGGRKRGKEGRREGGREEGGRQAGREGREWKEGGREDTRKASVAAEEVVRERRGGTQ